MPLLCERRARARLDAMNELERAREHRGRRLARIEERMTRLERLADELARVSDELGAVVARARRPHKSGKGASP